MDKQVKYDSKPDTLLHIKRVSQLLTEASIELINRANVHDASKLESPEKELFDEYTPKLKGCTYGSDEYHQYLKGLKVALDHHYENNSHHPEHYGYLECNGCFKRFKHRNGDEPELPKNGRCDFCGYSQFTERPNVNGFDLFDLMEMFFDWKAATERHDDGNILKSIKINKDRFEMSDQLCEIFRNTANRLGYES